MKIREITLFTNKLSSQLHFYKNILGFEILEENNEKFAFQVGHTRMKFEASQENSIYHYCFLIPSNQLQAAIKWLSQRLDIIKIEGNRMIQNFESWNADSIYFYDGAGNIAEFIVRYDLKNETTSQIFDLSQIIGLNEIGMPTKDVKKINQELEQQLNSKFWKGDLERFGTNGTQEGLFLLVNNELKKDWFPTDLETEASPFLGIFEVENYLYHLEFRNYQMRVLEKKEKTTYQNNL